LSLQDFKALLESTVAPIAKRLDALEAAKTDNSDATIKALLSSPAFASALPADIAADKKDSKLLPLRDAAAQGLSRAQKKKAKQKAASLASEKKPAPQPEVKRDSAKESGDNTAGATDGGDEGSDDGEEAFDLDDDPILSSAGSVPLPKEKVLKAFKRAERAKGFEPFYTTKVLPGLKGFLSKLTIRWLYEHMDRLVEENNVTADSPIAVSVLQFIRAWQKFDKSGNADYFGVLGASDESLFDLEDEIEVDRKVAAKQSAEKRVKQAKKGSWRDRDSGKAGGKPKGHTGSSSGAGRGSKT